MARKVYRVRFSNEPDEDDNQLPTMIGVIGIELYAYDVESAVQTARDWLYANWDELHVNFRVDSVTERPTEPEVPEFIRKLLGNAVEVTPKRREN